MSLRSSLARSHILAPVVSGAAESSNWPWTTSMLPQSTTQGLGAVEVVGGEELVGRRGVLEHLDEIIGGPAGNDLEPVEAPGVGVAGVDAHVAGREAQLVVVLDQVEVHRPRLRRAAVLPEVAEGIGVGDRPDPHMLLHQGEADLVVALESPPEGFGLLGLLAVPHHRGHVVADLPVARDRHPAESVVGSADPAPRCRTGPVCARRARAGWPGRDR